jgi:hypothetical protein
VKGLADRFLRHDPGRVARALCDREEVCGRIGARRRWDLACVDAMSARAGDELGTMACRFDPNASRRARRPFERCGATALGQIGALDVCAAPSMCAAH